MISDVKLARTDGSLSGRFLRYSCFDRACYSASRHSERNTVEEDEMVWACGKHGGQTHDVYGGTLKERDRLEDLVADGTITLKLACRTDIIIVQCLFDIILRTRCRFNL